MTIPERQKIIDALFGAAGKGESLYAILDSARNIDLAFQLQNIKGVAYISLYKDRKEEPMWDAAPYLVRYEQDSEFFHWVLKQGWGESWGIFLTSRARLEDLSEHFRQFLLMNDEDGKQMYFRFYDPRVLRVYLPTCNATELTAVFGPVTSYLLEDENPNVALRFRMVSDSLRQEKIQLA